MIFVAIAVLIIAAALAAVCAVVAFMAFIEEALPLALLMSVSAAVALTSVGLSIAGIVQTTP